MDHAGKKMLVVGSFASGSDLSRQLASLNIGLYTSTGEVMNGTKPSIPFTKVYISTSGTVPPTSMPLDEPTPWREYITQVPIISHISPPSCSHPRGLIHFNDKPPMEDVDTIIFATGYNFALPFCKATDRPWIDTPLLDGVITADERKEGMERDIGGMKGLGVKHLDELLLFLDNDRSIAFPTLRMSTKSPRGMLLMRAEYQVVPFPLAEVQSRLISLLWAELLPSFPDHPTLPPNPSNPYFTPPPNPPSCITPSQDLNGHNLKPQKKAIRKVVEIRQKLVFGAPYEWTYEEYLMGLMQEAGHDDDCWKVIEGWRRARRADVTLRRNLLGY